MEDGVTTANSGPTNKERMDLVKVHGSVRCVYCWVLREIFHYC